MDNGDQILKTVLADVLVKFPFETHFRDSDEDDIFYYTMQIGILTTAINYLKDFGDCHLHTYLTSILKVLQSLDIHTYLKEGDSRV